MTFQKDYRPLIVNACWAWILIWIPTIVMAMAISNTRARLDGGVLTYTTGAVTKRTTNIDLYRVRSVSSEDSFFAGGSLTFTYGDGTSDRLRYIRNANDLSPRFRALIDEQRGKQKIHSREDI